ncbi:MAG: glycosyltransferase family 2 protein [Sulfuritalea sp.]|nr:glycosyltransferase family 2 protein [Sulfuritalea sp.]
MKKSALLRSDDSGMEKGVTIVVVNYNAGKLLEPCIDLSLQQAGEVILVDNASADRSLDEVTRRFGANTRLRFIRNSTNLGFAVACNIGAEVATGQFVLFLNPDCALEEGAVSQLRLALDADPKAGMAGGLLIDIDGKEQGGGRRAVPTPWRSLVRVFHLSRFADRWPRLFTDFYLHKQALPTGPIEVEAISGACTMVKRHAMQDVGPWDEKYFLHCEDLDLCMRYRQKGWTILFVPGSRIVHHRGACSRSRPLFVEWHKHLGMLRFYRKFFRRQYPGALMWLVTLGVWLRFCAVVAYIGLRGIGGRFIGERNG